MRYISIDSTELIAYGAPCEYSVASSLCAILDDYLGSDNYKSFSALKMYKVGSLRHSDGVRLWRIDKAGHILGGRVMLFDDRGRFVRYESILKTLWPYTDAQYFTAPCFFGQHLLHDTSRPVAVVPSEVTALVGSQLEPRFNWLSTAGQNLTFSLLSELSGFDVTLFPGGIEAEYWKDAASAFPNVQCSSAFIDTDIDEYLKEMARNRG